ncbi:MAG: PAS domain S-box protein, partial [Candidatus Dadabacteria bacterium]|nr:PAS domain S-box protein [Candidatus Dadabacteria bacterium]
MKQGLPYREIVENSVDAIIVVDESFKIVLWNSAAETIFGYSSGEVIDKPLIGLIVPDRYKKAKKMGMDGFLKTGTGPVIGKTVQLEAKRKDGSEIDIELSVSVIQADKYRYVIGICRDISGNRAKEREIRDSEERLRILFDYAPDAYYLNDTSGRIVDANKAAEAMIGQDKAGLIGKTFQQIGIFRQDQIQKGVEILEQNKRGLPTGPDELVLTKKDGSELYVEVRTYPVIIQGENLVLGIARDISARKKAQEEVRSQKDFFEAVVNSLPGIFYVLDEKLTIIRWNSNLEKITGYSGREISGMTPFNFFDAEKHDEIRKRIEEVFAKGHTSIETDLVSKDGKRTPFFLSASDVAVGDRHYLVGVGIDISERKEAEEKLDTLNQLLLNRTIELRKSEIKWLSMFTTSKDAIYISTSDGQITDINPAGKELFGYSGDTIATLNARDLYANRDDRRRFEKEIRQREFVRDFEVVYKKKDGTLVECLETAVVRKDETGAVVGYQGIIRDISERKKLLEELKDATVNAEQANQAKSQFLANMSHEIRTPMNGILGFAELLLDEHLTEEQHEYVKTIHDSGRTLLALINDILDLSKVESGAMEVVREEFYLYELLNGVVSITRLKANEKGVALTLTIAEDTPAKIESDQDKLRQVVLNLVSNAVKFTDEGSVDVRVKTGTTKNGEARLTVSVRDTGCGIPAEKLGTIFEPFMQADNKTTRRYGGTGLGLSITRKLVELMGGTLDVSSEVGKGSVFSFSVPVSIADRAKTAERAGTAGVVVVVEDDPMTMKLYKNLLEKHGFTVLGTAHGRQALPLVLEHSPSLVILDIMLPDVSGWEVLQQLKKNEKTTDIPVVVISVLSEKEKAISLGAVDYLEKPITGTSLVNKVSVFTKGDKSRENLKVLIVDDDRPVLDFLSEMLSEEGFITIPFTEPDRALEYIAGGNEVNVMILDIFLGETTAFDLLKSIKEQSAGADIPVIFITGKAISDQETARLEGITHSLLDESRLTSQEVLRQIEKTVEGIRGVIKKRVVRKTGKTEITGTILLTEDNEVNRKLIIKILDREGYTVRVATNGREALDALEAAPVDLVLMDIQMPVMDGYEALSR